MLGAVGGVVEARVEMIFDELQPPNHEYSPRSNASVTFLMLIY